MNNFRPLNICFSLFVAAITLLLPTNVYATNNVAQGVKVVVLDAGHGGSKFSGAYYGGICEKDINLQVVLKLGAIIERELPDVKVVYTRTVDTLFSTNLKQDLQARADIAHKHDGDLFISIHSNAHPNTNARGVETLIMGETENEQRANQNAVYYNNQEELLDMSDEKTATIIRAYIENLQYTYGEYSEMMARLIQEEYVKLGFINRGVRRQLLRVLYATDMPSVLTEIGFMSNAQDLAYITSEKGQNAIANAIFLAVKQYITNVQRVLLLDAPTEGEAKSEQKSEVKAESKSKQPAKVSSTAKSAQQKSAQQRAATKSEVKRYTIQVMASSEMVDIDKIDSKGYHSSMWVRTTTGAAKYKYCIGDFGDRSAAQTYLKEVQKSFPQAFITTFEKEKKH